MERSFGHGRGILEKIELQINVRTIDITQGDPARIVCSLVFFANLIEQPKCERRIATLKVDVGHSPGGNICPERNAMKFAVVFDRLKNLKPLVETIHCG